MDSSYDVVVIGGGAAGLSAALTLTRARRSVAVVDAGTPRNAPAGGVHGYLGREGTPPAELMAIGRDEVRRYGGQVVEGTVRTLRPLHPGGAGDRLCFEVGLEDGRTTTARRLLVTTGLVDQLPEVPGVAERWGRDVLHCPYCHGWETRDRPIGVLASGPSAVDETLLLRQWSDDITLFLHQQPDVTDSQAERLDACDVRVVRSEVERLVVEDDRLTGLCLVGGEVVPLETLVVAPRLLVRAELLVPLGIQPDLQLDGHQVSGGFVASREAGATGVAGVYVAGNLADPAAVVVAAAASGLNAATAINADLVGEDVRDAVEARRRTPSSHEDGRGTPGAPGVPRPVDEATVSGS